jgi:hypothetical protein
MALNLTRARPLGDGPGPSSARARHLLGLDAAVLLLAAPGLPAQPAPKPDPFVRARGHDLILEGRPFRERGRWIALASSSVPALARAAIAPGRHRLRFRVTPGPRAHGLCLYGRPGKKAPPTPDAGPIQLRVTLR